MNSDNNTIVFIDYRNLLARNSMVTRDVDRRMHTRTEEEVNLGSDVLQTRTVELQIPTFQQDVLEATESENTRQRWEETRQSFDAASTIVAVCGTFGLGDSIMELRYCFNLADQYQNKEFIIQLPAFLIQFLEQVGKVPNNVRLAESVDSDVIESDDTFLWMLQVTGALDAKRDRSWTNLSDDQLKSTLANKQAQRKVLDFFTLENYSPTDDRLKDIMAKGGVDLDSANYSDAVYGLMVQVLGGRLNAEDIANNSLLQQKLLAQVPQDLEAVFLPDGKEQPIQDNNGFTRSVKSLPLESWDAILNDWPRNKKLGIVRGIAHPAYCDKVIALAQEKGINVEVIEGSLTELTFHLMRARSLFGMDSGTTHLCLDVARLAKQIRREIHLKQFFNANAAAENQYALVDTEILSYTSSDQDDMSDFTQTEDNILAQYVTSV